MGGAKKHGRGTVSLTGHLADDDVKIILVLVVDEPVVENTLTLVAEETEDLGFVPYLTRLALQNTCTCCVS